MKMAFIILPNYLSEYTITLSKENYSSLSQSIVISAGVSINKNFTLQPTAGELSVTSIASKYPPNVHFLEGIEHQVTYTANIDWGDLTPQTVRFSTPQGNYDVSTTENSVSQSFDMGSEFGVGGKLRVKAISAEGIESEEKEADFVMMSTPTLAGLSIPLSFSRFDLEDNLFYQTAEVEFSTALFDEEFDAEEVPEELPIFNQFGFNMDFIPTVKAEIDPATGEMTVEFAWTDLALEQELDKLGGRKNNAEKIWNIFTKRTKEGKVDKRRIPKAAVLGQELVFFPIFNLKSTFSESSQAWEISGGEACLMGQYEFKASRPFIIIAGPVPIPVFIKSIFNVELDATAGINNLNPLALNGKIGFQPSLTGAFGVGADEVLSVEGWATGGINTGLQFPDEPTLEKFIAFLTGGVKAYAFIFNWEKELGTCEWNYHTGQFNCAWSSLRAVTPSLISRDYLDKSNANAFNSPLKINGGSATTRVAALQESVLPLSDPFLASNGEAVAAVWIMDNPERSSQNRTMAVYSQFDQAVWTEPLPIEDDGTADFHPEIIIATDGAMLSAWENVKVSLENDELENLLQNLEISVSTFEPLSQTWQNTQTLTDNDFLDRSPKLSGEINNAMLTWISNENNHITGNSSAPNQLQFAQFDGASWTTPEMVAEIPFPLIKYDTIYQNEQGLVIMSLDTDDNLETITDRELFALRYDNGSWGSLTQLTTDEIADDNPQLALDFNGNVILVWLKENQLSSLSAEGFYLPTDSERQIILTDEAGYSGNLANAQLTTAADGKLAIFWAEPSEQNDSDIYALFYDPIFKKWSQQARQLSDDEETELRIAVTFADNENVIALYNRNLIGEQQVTATIQGQQVSFLAPSVIGTDLYVLQHTLSTDLAVESLEISPNNPEAGNLATLKVLVNNLGDQAIENAVLVFYNGDPAAGGTEIARVTLSEPLASQASREISIEWLVPESETPLTLFAIIDPINRSNNSQSITTLQPDLSVSHFRWARFTEKHLSLTARIKNEGSTPTDPVTVTITDSLNGEAELYSETLPTLAPYESKDLNFIWDISVHQAVKYKIKVTVDFQEVLEEFNENNNVSELIFTLGSLFANDLIIDFGTQYGIWTYTNNSTWTKLHALSSEELISGDMDGNGIDEIIIDFGTGYGIWLWMNNSAWVQLHSLSPESLVTGNIDGNDQDDIIIDFGSGVGIWLRMNNSAWVQLHNLSPESMTTGDIDGSGQDDIIIDFGTAYGIWLWMNNSDWVQLHNLSPDNFVMGDIDGSDQDDIIIDFGTAYGIWLWMNNSDWVQLHNLSPEDFVTGDIDGSDQDDIIIDFGATYGIWQLMNNDAWVDLHSFSPESMATGDIDSNGQDDIIIDFGPDYGIWQRMNNSDWVQLHKTSPEIIVSGNLDGQSFAPESDIVTSHQMPARSDNTMLLPESDAMLLPEAAQTELPQSKPQKLH